VNQAIDAFRENLSRIESNVVIYQSMYPLTHNTIDLSDILRAQIVLIVSAVDHYFHEIIRIKMGILINNPANLPTGFSNYQITLGDHLSSLLIAA